MYNYGNAVKFKDWVRNREREPYNSYGNGSAMRVLPVAWYSDDLDECIKQLRQRALDFCYDDYLDFARMIAGDEEMVRLLHGKGNPSFLNYRINQRIHSLIPFQSSLLQGIYFLTSRKGEFVLLFDDGNTHLSLRGIGKEPYRSLFEKA